MTGPVLVTGAAGYIGRFVCHELHRAGLMPIMLDDLSRGRVAPCIAAPVEDAALSVDAIVGVMRRHKPLAAIHLAGGRGGRHAKARADRQEDANVAGTRMLIEALQETTKVPVVLASSSAVYGDAGSDAAGEDAPLRATSAYGRAKIAAEDLLRRSGLSWAILRYANAAGADPEAMIGWYPEDRTLLPSCIAVAAGERPAVELYGIGHATPDGTAVRDYIHCRDIARATVHALRRRLAGAAAETFNVASGIGHSVLEVIAAVEKASGRRIPVNRHDRRPPQDQVAEVASLVLSPARLARAGFTARESDLAAIVHSAWAWRCKAAPLALQAAALSP